VAIPHPLGEPGLAPGGEYALRRRIVEAALRALATGVSGPQVFESAAGGADGPTGAVP
jgi:glycine reductase